MRKLPLMVLGILLIAFATYTSSTSVATADHLEQPYCCAWGDKIGDNELTFSVSGASGDALAAIQAAVEAWNAADTGLTLIPTSSKTADIKLSLKKGGGMIAGQAMRKIDRAGFVSACTISLSGKAFGHDALDTLLQVTEHELGHCLGLGHVNWGTDLMSPVVNDATAITQCHVEGVKAANAWKLISDGLTPILTPPRLGCL